ncbi:MAG: FAD-dependent oxidoreductase [Novosphingobium sp.]|nr:FAD-dependent oxidoreductase [Novosphingobium sp.]
MRLDDSYDLVVVGSGAGGMTAALTAAKMGRSVVVLEKESAFGGSTSRSGGAVWIPCNAHMGPAGVPDDFDTAMRYIEACCVEHTSAATRERMEAYVRTGPEMLSFLESEGLEVDYLKGYSDYYDERPGGQPQGRSIAARMIDSRELGAWGTRMNRYAMFAAPVGLLEFPPLSNAATTFKGKIVALKVGWRMMLQKLRKADILSQGSALQGRMLKLALERGVPVLLEAPVLDLIVERGRVAGVVVDTGGAKQTVRAGAVLLNAGGFSANAALRERHLPGPQQDGAANYLGNPGDTGEVLEKAIALGAATDQLEESWWVPGGQIPGGMPVSHTIDLSKPHCIMVDQSGQRYLDEAQGYMEIGQTMFARNRQVPAVPSWAIFDSRHRKRYGWGMAMPGKTPPEWLESGYLKKADTLAGLAALCAIPANGLAATVERFNAFARQGRDEDFARGARAYDRMNGDPSNKPNPSLGTVEQGPFYAAPVHVGDVGTCGGLVTDADGRVLKHDGSAIGGLYASGNIAANCFGRAYPGPGITIGQSMIFGYRAARAALGANSQPERQ